MKQGVKGKKASDGVKRFNPEKRIAMLAKSGAIGSAGRNAIAASFKKGLSVTALENGVIYRLHPDGSRTMIKLPHLQTRHYTTGKMLIK